MCGRKWTEDEIAHLRRLFYAGKSNRDIARILRRPWHSVCDKVYRIGLRRTSAPGGLFTLTSLAKLFGVGVTTAFKWSTSGAFPEAAYHHSRQCVWCISHDELWAWLEDKRSWHRWRPEQLTDGAWREHFTELRQDWLTTREVSRLIGYNPSDVALLRRLGKLQGETTGRYLWFHREAVERFMAGSER